MWLFKVRAHYTTQSYWVRASRKNNSLKFSEAKKLLEEGYHIEDWKYIESDDVFLSFPPLST